MLWDYLNCCRICHTWYSRAELHCGFLYVKEADYYYPTGAYAFTIQSYALIIHWSPREESNPYLLFRKKSFYTIELQGEIW